MTWLLVVLDEVEGRAEVLAGIAGMTHQSVELESQRAQGCRASSPNWGKINILLAGLAKCPKCL